MYLDAICHPPDRTRPNGSAHASPWCVVIGSTEIVVNIQLRRPLHAVYNMAASGAVRSGFTGETENDGSKVNWSSVDVEDERKRIGLQDGATDEKNETV